MEEYVPRSEENCPKAPLIKDTQFLRSETAVNPQKTDRNSGSPFFIVRSVCLSDPPSLSLSLSLSLCGNRVSRKAYREINLLIYVFKIVVDLSNVGVALQLLSRTVELVVIRSVRW